jgi:hypothetical protein
MTASQYITACIADASCTVEGIEVDVPITVESAKERKKLLGLKGAFSVAFFLTTIIGSYLPCIFRASRHFMVCAAWLLLIRSPFILSCRAPSAHPATSWCVPRRCC